MSCIYTTYVVIKSKKHYGNGVGADGAGIDHRWRPHRISSLLPTIEKVVVLHGHRFWATYLCLKFALRSIRHFSTYFP